MPRLSSSSTSWFRTGLPLLWLTAFGTASIVLQFASAAPKEMKLAFPIATVAGIGLFAWLAIPLKHVTLEGDRLLIEGRMKEAFVPLSDVESISEWIGVKPEIISLSLKRSSPFGRRIMFTPEFRILRLKEHPVVSVLRDALKKANQPPQTTTGSSAPSRV